MSTAINYLTELLQRIENLKAKYKQDVEKSNNETFQIVLNKVIDDLKELTK